MKKLTLTIAAAVMVASTMMACGNSNNNQQQGEQTEARCENCPKHHCPDGKGHHKGGPGRMDASKRVEMMAEQLGLTDEQKSELLAYYTQQDSVRMANRPQKGEQPAERPSKEEMEANMKAEREAEQAQLKNILTEEQYAKWVEAENNRPAPREKK